MHVISSLSSQLNEAKEDFKSSVARRLKSARDEKGYTQEKVAGIVGLKRTTITNIERGTQSATLLELALLCDALDVTADYVLGR